MPLVFGDTIDLSDCRVVMRVRDIIAIRKRRVRGKV